MTWLDWVIVVMLVWFMVQGLIKGVTPIALGVLAIFVAFLVATLTLPVIGGALVAVKGPLLPPDLEPGWRRMLGFVVVFVAVYGLLSLLINILPGGKRPSSPAQILGLAGGVLKATAMSMVLVGALLASPAGDAITKDLQRSALGGFVANLYQKNVGRDLQAATGIKLPAVDPENKF
jgi:uncharacterized membrane protein required for colicin V production